MVGVVCGFCGLGLAVCFYVCWLVLLSVVICCLFDCCSYLVGVAGFGLVVDRVSSWILVGGVKVCCYVVCWVGCSLCWSGVVNS